MQDAVYQLVILGGRVDTWRDPLLGLLRKRLSELGPEVAASLKIIEADELDALRPTAPAVGVYLASDRLTDADAVRHLVESAVPVIPVVDSLDDFPNKVPEALVPINGIAAGMDPDFTEIANLILENLSLLRRSRKLFISYLRDESTPVAHQLRSAFDDAGYDAFLDTSSVPKGDDFQSVLWHRLLDSDVMVVLDTPKFLTSRWTTAELAEASAMGVGLLRVIWPGVDPVRGAELAEQLYLEVCDFNGDQLTDKAAERVVRAAEALRARCIAARHNNLVVEFCAEAPKRGAKTAIQPERYVLAVMPDGKRIAVVPAVGVPDAQRYREASARFPIPGELADEAVLIYDHRGMLQDWRDFLEWLDGFLPVRSLRVTDTAARLGLAR